MSSFQRFVRGEDDPRVYAIDTGGRRRWVPDVPTLRSVGGWEQVQTEPSWDALAQKYPPGRPLPSIESGQLPWLIMTRGATDIFLVDDQGRRRPYDTDPRYPDVDHSDEVQLVTPQELEAFPLGKPIGPRAPFCIRSFRVRNFRCFSDFELGPLGRINLITGMNNSGKTALLEALWLHAAVDRATTTLALQPSRGMGQPPFPPDETLGWIFRDRSTTSAIETSSEEQGEDLRRTVRIDHLTPPWTSVTRKQYDEAAGRGVDPWTLRIQYMDSLGVAIGSIIQIVGLTESRKDVSHPAGPAAQYRPIYLHSPQREAELFSRIDAMGRQQELVDVMKLLEPNLERLAVLVSAGDPIVHGGIRGRRRLVPLPLMGAGMLRLFSLLLAIDAGRNTLVMFDEIDNGLHHSLLPMIWRALGEAVRRANVQLFATTHSWECIEAAHDAFASDERADFRLHRLDRDGEEIRAVTYDRKALDAAVKAPIEVR